MDTPGQRPAGGEHRGDLGRDGCPGLSHAAGGAHRGR
jgi:hypothetical protein